MVGKSEVSMDVIVPVRMGFPSSPRSFYPAEGWRMSAHHARERDRLDRAPARLELILLHVQLANHLHLEPPEQRELVPERLGHVDRHLAPAEQAADPPLPEDRAH